MSPAAEAAGSGKVLGCKTLSSNAIFLLSIRRASPGTGRIRSVVGYRFTRIRRRRFSSCCRGIYPRATIAPVSVVVNGGLSCSIIRRCCWWRIRRSIIIRPRSLSLIGLIHVLDIVFVIVVGRVSPRISWLLLRGRRGSVAIVCIRPRARVVVRFHHIALCPLSRVLII